jgi:site-specific DNA recombinase
MTTGSKEDKLREDLMNLLRSKPKKEKKEEKEEKKIIKIISNGPKCYGYTRVSTEKQVQEGHSLENQKSKIERYCREKGLPEPIIMADEGISGKSTETREKYNEMIENVKKGDYIVSYSLSRLGRNANILNEFLDTMKKKGVKVQCLDKEMDDKTPEGNFMTYLNCGLSQLEREKIGQRTSEAMQEMKAKGELKTKGKFGYRAKENKLIEVPEEIEVIKYITEILYEEPKMRDIEITRRLQEHIDKNWPKVTMRRDGRSEGKNVHQCTIAKIIKDNNLREIVKKFM